MHNKYMLIAVVCLVAFFVNNSTIRPDIMECRNLITAREIVSDGNWLVPRMNGELRLEKPPLPTWIAAVVEYVTPNNLSAQRCMSGLAGVVLIFFFFLFGKSFSNKSFAHGLCTRDDRRDYSLIAALMLLTCYNVVLMSRTATWDIYCHAFMMCGIYYLWLGLYEDNHVYRHFSLAGVMMGLSFLSKGPVSFYALLLPFILCLILYKRVSLRGKYGALTLMIVICLALSSWWYIYLLMANPEYTRYVVNKESSSWINHSTRPWWYYWRFFAETGIWAPFMLMALYTPYWKKRLQGYREYKFMLTWVIFSLILMSCTPEKKYRYILPMMIPCCYTMGFLICHWRRWAFKMVYIVTAIFAVAEGFGIPFIASKILADGKDGISNVQSDRRLVSLPFYRDSRAGMRIEIVYAANRKILPLNLRDDKSVIRALPCALVTHQRVGTLLTKKTMSLVDTIYCGHYDDTYFRSRKKSYTDDFKYHVTILRLKSKHLNNETDK
jgi:4-amino-4-deoxy-L-arabinose transferase-like glycosyltransferase